MKIKLFKNNYIKSSSPSPIFLNEIFLERFDQFSTLKNDLENQNFKMRLFIILASLTITLFSKKNVAYVVSFPTRSKNHERTLLGNERRQEKIFGDSMVPFCHYYYCCAGLSLRTVIQNLEIYSEVFGEIQAL